MRSHSHLSEGNNVHPAAFIDPQTGAIHNCPSSSWAAMTRAFRLGFEFLDALSAPAVLFDAATKLVIAPRRLPLCPRAICRNKGCDKRDRFSAGVYRYLRADHRAGSGIVNNAKHLGLQFKPYAHPDPDEDRLSGLTLQESHGTKLHVSVAFYDKLVRLQQMDQEGTLSIVEVQTVDQSVREDITAQSSFVLTIVGAARGLLQSSSPRAAAPRGNARGARHTATQSPFENKDTCGGGREGVEANRGGGPAKGEDNRHRSWSSPLRTLTLIDSPKGSRS
jgi:hypothetical protein